MRRSITVCVHMLAAAAVAGLLSGCGSIEPWVKPYERERLASPLLQFSRDGLSAKHFEHVREVREGGRGATGVQGGGCGCN
ncbi:DUF4266 domain-containing protein [Piscinibacter sp. HJYY11]|uniref:DUF4266 domain-containing protein n=1 Tax=Piscinibacter sp. HJYY11 TaxID=2801333 RepID=UPI001F2211D7|nr:DUF4266 domain-containing protein [Piscinibacter sp. HJYY11]